MVGDDVVVVIMGMEFNFVRGVFRSFRFRIRVGDDGIELVVD